ncbi:hypothetical protein ACVCID_25520 [Burkholderia glumae]
MPTVITFVSPAQRLSRAFNHVGQNSMKIFSSSGSVLCGHQQSGEDGAQIAELIADLSPEARRSALRMLSEFATTARERDDLREQVERMRAELEHRVLSDSLPQAPAKTRRRLKV